MANDVFKALSSTTRLKMLRILAKKEMHITGLARELNLSVPVVAKHSKLLEKTGLTPIFVSLLYSTKKLPFSHQNI